MDLNKVLRGIGLSYKEAEVYLATLSLGPTSVLAISKETLIHRTIVYQVLEESVRKGIIRTTLKNKRRLYVAIEPKDLIAYLKRNEEVMTEALPDLEAMAHKGESKPIITYFEGRDQLRQMYRSHLYCQSKDVQAYFPSRNFIEVFGKREMEDIVKERIERKIAMQVVRPKQWEEDFYSSDQTKDAYRNIRFLPDEQAPRMGFYIYDHTVNLFSPTEENFGIQIESQSYADLMRCLFENLWRSSHP